jgi:hypothetical protein
MTSENPVEAYEQVKAAAKEQRKADEVALWRRWKEGGEQPKHLAPLLKLYEPVFAKKTRDWKAPRVPESSFKGELHKHFIKALQKFDPNRNVALNTWVESMLPKAMRFNNRYQNLLYIPEGQAREIGKIQRATDALSEDLGRKPTSQEIAQHLGHPMTAKRVDTIRSAVRPAIPMSTSPDEAFDYGTGGEGQGRSFEDQQIAIAQNILPKIFPGKPEFHVLFNHVFGTNGAQKISSTTTLAKKMGKSQSQVSRMKTQMGTILRKHMGLEDDED